MKKWFKDLGIKIVKTMAETAIGVIGACSLVTEVNWQLVLNAVLFSAIMTILLNLKDIKE